MIGILLAQANNNTGNPAFTIVLFGGLIFVFYFLMIRPQRNRMRAHQELMSNLQIGDEIETVGGIFGTIRSMSDDEFQLEVSPGTTVRVSRAAVRRKVWQEEEEDQGSPDASE